MRPSLSLETEDLHLSNFLLTVIMGELLFSFCRTSSTLLKNEVDELEQGQLFFFFFLFFFCKG